MMVLFLSYTGVRFGEMAALRVGRVDFLRRRALIAESVTPVKGVVDLGHDERPRAARGAHSRVSRRRARVARCWQGSDELVFLGVRGAVMRAQTFQRACYDRGQRPRSGNLGLHPHELRHTAASLAIAAGADVKVVQQMLGHKSGVDDDRPLWAPLR